MNRTIKAGIFAVVTLIILFFGWIWLAGIEFKKQGYEVTIKFTDVTGLKVNDPVRVGGVEKGSVKKIDYRQEYIEVKVNMEKDVLIYDDANADILDVAMISGTKYVRLNAGTSGIPLKEGTVIPGSPSLGIPLSMLGDIGQKVNTLLLAVNTSDVINSLGTTLKISAVLSKFNSRGYFPFPTKTPIWLTPTSISLFASSGLLTS